MEVTKAWEPDDWNMMNKYQPGPGGEILQHCFFDVRKGV